MHHHRFWHLTSLKPICFSLMFMSIGTFCACQKKPSVVSFAEAMKTCIPDTTRWGNGPKEYGLKYASPDCLLGAQLPEWSATTMNGKNIDKAYLQGKVNVINFWFQGCAPCEAQREGFNMIVEKYKSSPVNFIAIGTNTAKEISDFLVDHPFNMDHIASGGPIIRGPFKHKWGFPFTIVTDQNQKILFVKTGGSMDPIGAVDDLQNEIIPVIDMALKGPEKK